MRSCKEGYCVSPQNWWKNRNCFTIRKSNLERRSTQMMGRIGNKLSFRIHHLLYIFLIVSAILCLLVLGFKPPTKVISGDQISGSRVISISVNPNTYDYISYLRLNFIGHLDGQATILLPWGENRVLGPGKFDLTVTGAYESDSAMIEYQSLDARSGRILIRYDFLEL